MHVVRPPPIISGVFSKVQKLFEVQVPRLKVRTDRSLSLASLVDRNCCIVDDFQKWLPNFGLGFRFEVEPRMNLRLDLGFGKNSAGFYFSFNEAF